MLTNFAEGLTRILLRSRVKSSALDRKWGSSRTVSESKMESSPMVWQDVKEGYIRNYTIRYTNTLLDSLGNNDLSSFDAGLRHFYKIENLRDEIKQGGEYKHTIVPNDTPMYNINYFYSSFK